MNAPPSEATYITSSEEVLWGILLVAATLVIHAFGMLGTLNCSRGFQARFGQRSLLSGLGNLILASWLIMMVHLLEVMMWAGFFQWKHCFVNYSTAGYFAFLEYTTVGSDFNLPLNWRLLEGMIATAGLLGFAWSTGVLLTLAQDFQDQQLARSKARSVPHTATERLTHSPESTQTKP